MTKTKKTSSTSVSAGKPKLPVLHRLIRDMSSEAYHGTTGTWSSSQLKEIIEDEEIFIRKYVTKEIPREEREAFDTGTYFHTGCLEPHKVASEIAVYGGKVRHGNEWEKFKATNKGKTVITLKQKEQGDGMIAAVNRSPVSKDYLEGEPEVSLFNKIVIKGGQIFAPHYKKMLGPNGWMNYSREVTGGFEIIIKVRADCLGSSFISDLKSTAGRANKEESVRGSISKYKYDLSAALYLDMFSLINEDVSSFIWIFASKEKPVAAPWEASRENIMIGRAKWSKAVKRLADMAMANWEIVDCLRIAEPLHHEREWLREKEADLL